MLSVIAIAGQFGFCCFFFFQAEDGIRDLVRSRGLGDVYKRQLYGRAEPRNGNNFPMNAGVSNMHRTADGRFVAILSLIHI